MKQGPSRRTSKEPSHPFQVKTDAAESPRSEISRLEDIEAQESPEKRQSQAKVQSPSPVAAEDKASPTDAARPLIGPPLRIHRYDVGMRLLQSIIIIWLLSGFSFITCVTLCICVNVGYVSFKSQGKLNIHGTMPLDPCFVRIWHFRCRGIHLLLLLRIQDLSLFFAYIYSHVCSYLERAIWCYGQGIFPSALGRAHGETVSDDTTKDLDGGSI